MKDIFIKLKKTISFWILILSILFLLVGLVLKCIYLYEYNRLEKDITNAINNKQVYKYAYGATLNGETKYGELDFSDSAFSDTKNFTRESASINRNAILYQLEIEGKRFCIYYNNISNKIIVVCVCCFLFFGYLCYIKLHPERKIKFSESDMNNTNTMSYSYDKPVVECPYCHSTNTKKISTTSKVLNTVVFGIFGTKRHKQWHCNNCNSDF